MKTIIIFLTTVLSIGAFSTNAQNLVPNYSFEIYSSCPNNFSQLYKALPWHDPTFGSSDYYNACDTGYMNVPFCGTGFQFSRTGFAHAGLWALNGLGNYNREYIQVQLTTPLLQDSCYLVEFYCNLDNHAGYAIKKLGAYLSDIAISNTGSSSVLQYTPHIVSTEFLADTLNWMHISGYFYSNGGEQYLTIGDFKLFNGGDTLHTGNGTYQGAYYFIDDVTVQKVPKCDTVTTVQEYSNNDAFNLFPNPCNGFFNIKTNRTVDMQIKIYNVLGACVYQNNYSSSNFKIDLSNQPNGIYYISINGTAIKNEKIVIIK